MLMIHKYTHLSLQKITQFLIVVHNCMLAIQIWMNKNMLKPNPSKTEFMVIGNSTQRKKIAHIFPVELLDQNFAEINSIQNLGVAFDPAFSFKKHVSNICRSALYHIRDIRRIRIHLNKSTAISLANALVSSRLDYCNSLLFGCSEKYKTSLQRVQNCLAQVVTRSSRLSESRPLLKSMHWLPFKSHSKFKLNLLTYKALFMGTPYYWSKRNYGHSSFVVAAPRLWNKLSFNIVERYWRYRSHYTYTYLHEREVLLVSNKKTRLKLFEWRDKIQT